MLEAPSPRWRRCDGLRMEKVASAVGVWASCPWPPVVETTGIQVLTPTSAVFCGCSCLRATNAKAFNYLPLLTNLRGVRDSNPWPPT